LTLFASSPRDCCDGPHVSRNLDGVSAEGRFSLSM
jgi:hypothetical protein